MVGGALIVSEEAVSVHLVEVPLVRVDDEVVFGVVRAGQAVQPRASGVQGVADQSGVSHPGGCAGLVRVQLHTDGVRLVGNVPGFDRVEHVLPSALGEGEPCLDLPRPRLDLAVAGLVADPECCGLAEVGGLPMAPVVLDARVQQEQPSGVDEKLPVLT
ncbi:hypothetical protein ACLB9X_28050 [Streptomyces sp. 5K101]|uniref:hypothetical protein n=1 Tax=Streptomyces sp. 5K101 TaxID=3390037 RepID=UPI0039759507